MDEITKPKSASIEDTLFDQLEFLLRSRVEHLESKNGCDCGDCLRYSRVCDILMEPFVEKVKNTVKSTHKKVQKAAV